MQLLLVLAVMVQHNQEEQLKALELLEDIQISRFQLLLE